eukprot:8032999-Ditylum_brightwellii.AAC.3
MFKASNTPLEHLFDDHVFCGSWCKRKKELGMLANSEREMQSYKVYYQNKTRDAHLYKFMKEAYEPFQQRHILEQSQHPYDTQEMRA